MSILAAAIKLHPFADLNIWTSTLGEDARSALRAVGFLPASVVHRRSGVEQDHPSLLVSTIPADAPEDNLRIGARNMSDMGDWDVRMLYSMLG